MAIESSPTLKTLGINILGKFLSNKDSNSKYVSLYMLQRTLKYDPNAVQKHKNIILDCLKVLYTKLLLEGRGHFH
jgi:AP-1 complex subunit gamma-1